MIPTNHPNMRQIHPTAKEYYEPQGTGVGAHDGALARFEKATGEVVGPAHRCLEIGCAGGDLLDQLKNHRHCQNVIGVDITPSSYDACKGKADLVVICDASHATDYVLCENCIDFAFCTETIEHLTNPFFMVANVKRMLKHCGYFTLAFPQPDRNLGYGGGEHAHVYPGFLRQDSFERFMMQLYFKKVWYEANGSSDWYVFKNYKPDDGAGMMDAFDVIAGNYTEQQLYGCMEGF